MADVDALKAELAAAAGAPERFLVVKKLGAAFLEAGNFVDARRAFEAAFKFAPADLEVLRGLRHAFIGAGLHREALNWFQLEMAQLPQESDRARLMKELGEHFQNRLNDFENAQTAFARARQFDASVFAERPAAPPPVEPELAALDLPPPPPPPPLEAPPAAAPPPSTATPGAVPVPVPRKLAPAMSAARPTAPNRTPVFIAAGLVVALGIGGFAWTRRSQAAEGLSLPCPGTLERRDDLEGGIQQFECVNELTARRFKVRGTTVLEVVDYAHGQPEGSATLTPGDGVRIEGAYAAGSKTGIWRTFHGPLLVSDEEWLAGARSGLAHEYQGDGGVLESQQWRADQREGPYAQFDSRGKPLLTGEYHADQKSGAWASYDQRGSVKEKWNEPRTRDAGVSLGTTSIDRPTEELFGGQNVAWWRIRYAEVSALSKKDPTLEPLRALTLQRARAAGLTQNATSGQLEVAP